MKIDCKKVKKVGGLLTTIDISFQDEGRPLITSIDKMASLNSLCKSFGIPTNPLKDVFGKKAALEHNFYRQGLSEDYLLYCAHKVDPLVDLYHLMKDLMCPDYQQFLQELTERQLRRLIDPKNSREFRSVLNHYSGMALYISNVPPGMLILHFSN